MVTDHRTTYVSSFRAAIGSIVYPIYEAIDLPVRMARWSGEVFAERTTLRRRNAELEERYLRARAKLEQVQALEAENARLRKLLDSSKRLDQRVGVAELVSVDLDPFSHRILLNKGSRKEVFVGQPLLDADGVMGQVTSITATHAFAMLISDPAHALPVQVNRTGLRTIAFGTGHTGYLSLPNVPISADVSPGDLLVTSGLGGRFPGGFPVATVTDVLRDPSATFAEVIATPTAALDRSREVLLLWPPEPEVEAITEDPAPEPDQVAQGP